MRTTNRHATYAPHADLSREEARLTALLAAGCSTEVIGRELGVDGVELHRLLTALGEKVEPAAPGS